MGAGHRPQHDPRRPARPARPRVPAVLRKRPWRRPARPTAAISTTTVAAALDQRWSSSPASAADGRFWAGVVALLADRFDLIVVDQPGRRTQRAVHRAPTASRRSPAMCSRCSTPRAAHPPISSVTPRAAPSSRRSRSTPPPGRAPWSSAAAGTAPTRASGRPSRHAPRCSTPG